MPLSQDPDATAYFASITAPTPFSQLGVAHAVLMSDVAVTGTPTTTVERCTIAVPEGLSRAVPKRIRGYLAGRHCAAHALNRLTGLTPDVGRGPHGEPLWPAGVIGSITHSDAYAGAIVVAASQYRGIGIDCERIISAATCEEITESVVPEVATIDLRDVAAQRLSREALVSIAFSAKESVFKCVFPLYGDYFEFRDVVLHTIDVANGLVQARLSPVIGARAQVEDVLSVQLSLHPEQVFTAVRV